MPPRHTLTDHALGALAQHQHDGEADHDHDDDPRHELLEATSRALEATPFVSIGVDIGSAGVQIVFSRLTMRGPGEPTSLRRLIKSRETLWRSAVALTPWRDDAIDVEALRDIVDAAFNDSGLHPDDVETGAAIITGDAATVDNARALLAFLAEEIGELVSAVAGHRMEAMLAAFGSGAAQRSLETGARILLVDIGGGTTKFATIVDGRVAQVAALSVGARVAAFDAADRLERLTPTGVDHAQRAGVDWRRGATATAEEKNLVCASMADLVVEAVRNPGATRLDDLWLTQPLAQAVDVDCVMFSGGVAEFVYARETRDFGDLGRGLGESLRQRLADDAWPWRLEPAGECIRATALGAAEHSVQISGDTSFISSPARLLPRRNLPVVAPAYSFAGDIDAEALSAAITNGRRMLELDRETEFALALRWRGDLDHVRLSACAKGIADALADVAAAGQAIFLALEGDAALNLAGVLRAECGMTGDMLVLDGLVLRDFDWIDIGRLRLPSYTVPVTVKSLLFGKDQKSGR